MYFFCYAIYSVIPWGILLIDKALSFSLSPSEAEPSHFKVCQLLNKLNVISFINLTLGIGSSKWTGFPFSLVTIVKKNICIVTNKILFKTNLVF